VQSACRSASGPVGFFFDPRRGFYVEVTLAFDPSDASPGSWPAVWSVPREFLLDQTCHFIEIDYIEGLPSGGITFALHEWTGTSQSQVVFPAPVGLDARQMTRYGLRLTPMADNGGLGCIERFINGVRRPEMTLTYTSGGLWSLIESQHQNLMLGTGFNWPCEIESIGVWQ
jgi:hypothetical protein